MLNDPEYWLDKYSSKASEGTRNKYAVRLACQLRDNRVPERQAKRTMRRYADRVPNPDSYTEAEALATVRSVYKDKPREPVDASDETEAEARLQKRAHDRERELFEAFREDPTQLTEMEVKRIEESDVVPNGLYMLRLELAREYMTDEEKGVYSLLCMSDERTYRFDEMPIQPSEVCDCGCASFHVPSRQDTEDNYALTPRRRATMSAPVPGDVTEAYEGVMEILIERALKRRSNDLTSTTTEGEPDAEAQPARAA